MEVEGAVHRTQQAENGCALVHSAQGSNKARILESRFFPTLYKQLLTKAYSEQNHQTQARSKYFKNQAKILALFGHELIKINYGTNCDYFHVILDFSIEIQQKLWEKG